MTTIQYTPTVNQSEATSNAPEFKFALPKNDDFIFQGYAPKFRGSADATSPGAPAETVSTETVSTEAAKGKKYTDSKEFVKDMTAAYERVLESKGIDKAYARYLVAQDALESNWGKSSLSEAFNFGGVKAVKGSDFVEKLTAEYKNGIKYQTKAKFRRFKNLDDYANYKVSLLSGNRYKAFTGDVSGFYTRVAAGGYATDPNYAAKLTQMYNSSPFKDATLTAKQGGVIPSRIDDLVSKFNKQFCI